MNPSIEHTETFLPSLTAVCAMAPRAAGHNGLAFGSVGHQPASEQEQLLLQHLPMVRSIARRMRERLPLFIDLEDLVSAGTLGLMDAVSKFDPSKQVQFKSYAQFRVRGAILDSLRSMDWSPRDLRRKGREVQETVRALTQIFGRVPTDTELAEELELSLAEYQRLLGDLKGLEIGSLHTERNDESGEEMLAYVQGPAEDDPLFRCLHGEMRQRLANAVEQLPENERLVLTLYYFEELTMKEIGLTLGVVESRISQIRSSAVVRLRAALSEHKTGKRSRPSKNSVQN